MAAGLRGRAGRVPAPARSSGIMAAGPARPGREMKRRLPNLLSILSLLLCVAALALWVRSYRVTDVLTVTSPEPNNGSRITGQVQFLG